MRDALLAVGVAARSALAARRRRGARPTAEPRRHGRPTAIVDLAHREGVALVKGAVALQRHADRRGRLHGARPDLQPTGAPIRTYDYRAPRRRRRLRRLGVGSDRADDARRAARHRPALLQLVPHQRHDPGAGRRASIRPGSTVVFETSLDDYAEVWVDGELPRRARPDAAARWSRASTRPTARARPRRPARASRSSSRSSASTARSRTRRPTSSGSARRRSTSTAPAQADAVAPHEVNVEVVRLDPALDAIVPPDAEDREAGREASSSPRARSGCRDGGYLLFSDPNANTHLPLVRRTAQLSVFRDQERLRRRRHRRVRPAGLERADARPQGRLTINEHGNRRVIRLEKNGAAHGARRPLRGQAPQQPERSRLPVGRRALLHRPAVRPAEVLRRSAQGAAVQRRLRARGRASSRCSPPT